MIENHIGSPATGDNFFDREREQSRFWRRIETDNVLLLAPRRVGKTSLLQRITDTASERDYHPVFLSVSKQREEIDFVRSLYDSIQAAGGDSVIAVALKAVGKQISRLPRPAKLQVGGLLTVEFADATKDEWQVVGEALLRALRESDKRWLIMIDELPLFVLKLLAISRSRAQLFLNWFREARIDRAMQGHVRWVLCGSIGLDTVASRERLGDTINDLALLHLGPFTDDDARSFLDELASSHGLTIGQPARERFIGRVGWLIPYHLQLLFAALIDRDVATASVEDVDAAYDSLLEPNRKSYFDYWSQRLHDELGAIDSAFAHEILAVSAVDPNGATRQVIDTALQCKGLEESAHTRFLIDALESDGYLVRVDGRFRFRSPLLRDYWLMRVL